MDFDGSWAGLVHSVQFIFSLSIPSDIVSLSQPPFLSPGWRTGLPNPVDCIIYYKTVIIILPYSVKLCQYTLLYSGIPGILCCTLVYSVVL